MKTNVRTLVALLVFLPAALQAHDKTDNPSSNCGCACCQGKATCCCREETTTTDSAKPDEAKRYPLKGVIVDLLAGPSALLVKHEAIPGYMMAMTMLFKVDAATFQTAVKGQAITATLVERDGGYWLENVNPTVESGIASR